MTLHPIPNRKKSFSIFPSFTKLPPRESFVSDIPAGDGNIEKLFLQYIWISLFMRKILFSFLSVQQTPFKIVLFVLWSWGPCPPNQGSRSSGFFSPVLYWFSTSGLMDLMLLLFPPKIKLEVRRSCTFKRPNRKCEQETQFQRLMVISYIIFLKRRQEQLIVLSYLLS